MIKIISLYGNAIITKNIIHVKDLKNEFIKRYHNIFFNNLIIYVHGTILNDQEKLSTNYRYNVIIKPIICNNH